ncbi:DeoR/GlpR family DNA-binding transcription regulator [Streptomyces sp. R1]|uniref:DeoR/GlpR family DNA-binding transcription regulator n=1 Tax=Streptomyces sp. R1 TaxID=1509279 RepID=UPI001E65607E|nr:DeoR/GlpR family DNA-binding transcription regulator [Streptomyces sp. R1]MCC8339033.1 DeoR/GlpR family DNA-binding transcription regulator [Streptomyces sp. R1]
MDSDMRKQEILAQARSQGSVDVRVLSAVLGVSPETVRRDLRSLEEHGLVKRIYGGAFPVESAAYETTLAMRTQRQLPQKTRIAASAAELVGEAETIFIDEGFTPQLLADSLTDRPLTVVTASLVTASILSSHPRVSVIQLGGRVRPGTAATVGHDCTRMLAGIVIDLAFLGANGISRDYGLTTPDPSVGEVKAQAVRSSKRRVLLGISRKFGVVNFSRFAEISDFETIVTDTGLSSIEAQRYGTLGPQVIRV